MRPASAEARVRQSVEGGIVLLGVLAILVAVLFWPRWNLVPAAGLDQSWLLGLSWASQLGLEWGPEVLFTWGPLGFVGQPMAFSATQIVIASIAHAGAVIAAVLAAYYLARSQTGLARHWAAVVAAVAVSLSLAYAPSPEVMAVFVGLALLVSGRWWVLLALGIAVGVFGHMKLSQAMVVAGVAALGAFGGLGVRGLVGLVATAVAAWIGVWVMAGQPIANLPTWISGAAEVISGYGYAMSRNSVLWQILVAVFVFGVVLAFAWLIARTLSRRQLAATLLIVLLMFWLGAKAAFTRHDGGHAPLILPYPILLTLALMLVDVRGRHARWGLAVLLTSLIAYGTVGGNPLAPLERGNSVGTVSRTLSALESTDYRTEVLRGAKQDLRRKYEDVTPELRETIGTQPAFVDSIDISALWGATTGTWRPLPPLQGYAMYTDELDQRSLESIRKDPRLILRHAWSIDARNPMWDAPRYQAYVYCEYGIIDRSRSWQVLAKVEESKCGPVTTLAEVEVKAGEPVAVPSTPGSITYATIELDRSLSERLLSILAKPLAIDWIEYGPDRWRWAHDDLATRLMLNAPFPSPAFSKLPIEPYETLTLTRDAMITFETAPMPGWAEAYTAAQAVGPVVTTFGEKLWPAWRKLIPIPLPEPTDSEVGS